MKTSLSDYEQRVFAMIEKMKVGQSAFIKDWAKPETTNDFISSIKKRIDIRDDCEFNGDYSKFRKIRTWEEEMEYWKNSDSNKVKQLNNKKCQIIQ